MRARFATIVAALIFILISIFRLPANAQELSKLIKDYETCKNISDCKDIELTMIRHLLRETDFLDVVEEMPADEDIKYEIINAKLASDARSDYAIKIVIDNLGYIVTIIRDADKDSYIRLPIIEKGYIYNLYAKDLTGDGNDELIFSGRGTGTGYSSVWTAIYKYRSNRMELVWSGLKEESSSHGEMLEMITGTINIFNVPGKKSKSLYLNQFERRTNIETDEVLYERCQDKVFVWSDSEFKFVEEQQKKVRVK